MKRREQPRVLYHSKSLTTPCPAKAGSIVPSLKCRERAITCFTFIREPPYQHLFAIHCCGLPVLNITMTKQTSKQQAAASVPSFYGQSKQFNVGKASRLIFLATELIPILKQQAYYTTQLSKPSTKAVHPSKYPPCVPISTLTYLPDLLLQRLPQTQPYLRLPHPPSLHQLHQQ